jgi:hypothetical protein
VEDGGAGLRTKLQWLKELREKANSLQRQGLDAVTIQHKLLGPEDLFYYATNGALSRLRLIKGLLEAVP